MPMLIEHIDAIARKKKRDVLFLHFPVEGNEDSMFPGSDVDWDQWPARQKVIAWLDQNQIPWCPCGHFANENLMMGYRGWIYVDVPFRLEDPVYQRLQNYLETPEGEMKIPGVTFCYLPLEMALENAHHDVPGFWERWAENF